MIELVCSISFLIFLLLSILFHFILFFTVFVGFLGEGGILDGVGFLESILIFAELGHGVDEFIASELHEGSNSPGAKTEADSGDMHAEAKRCSGEKGSKESTVADHEELNVKLSEEDDPEPHVGEWSLEDVELAAVSHSLFAFFSDGTFFDLVVSGHLVKDTAVDHVETVHHNKDLEHEGLVHHSVGRVAVR